MVNIAKPHWIEPGLTRKITTATRYVTANMRVDGTRVVIPLPDNLTYPSPDVFRRNLTHNLKKRFNLVQVRFVKKKPQVRQGMWLWDWRMCSDSGFLRAMLEPHERLFLLVSSRYKQVFVRLLLPLDGLLHDFTPLFRDVCFPNNILFHEQIRFIKRNYKAPFLPSITTDINQRMEWLFPEGGKQLLVMPSHRDRTAMYR